MNLSRDGLEVLKRLEGFREEPYKDSAKLWTIGYGHLLQSGEGFSSISEEKATEILLNDVRWAEESVDDLVRVDLSQPRFDALCCFTFNVGRRAFAESTLLRKLNEGNYSSVCHELAKWVNAGGKRIQGLVNRRAKECAMWEGEYDELQ